MSDTIQDEIIKDFAGLDWLDKYELLIASAKNIKPMNKKFRTEDNAIIGCQSKVWIITSTQDDKLVFELDSDAMITKGIMSLLLRVFNNRYPEEILNTDLYFIDDIGLKSNLSPARSNGLQSIINRIREIAEEAAA